MDTTKLREEIKKSKVWVKEQQRAPDFEVIHGSFDPIKDFRTDPGCYVLIKVYPETREIGLAVVDYKNVIQKEFRGRIAQEIYNTLFNTTKYITRLDHAAYIGKELARAELALKEGREYIQE